MTTMTEQATITVGRGDVYPGGRPTGVITQIGDRDYVILPSGKLLEQCGRCQPAWSGSVEHYGHVYAGVCFECAGDGYRKAFESVEALTKVLARRAKDKARRERKAEAEREAKLLAVFAWTQANPELANDLAAVLAIEASDPDAYIDGFVLDLAQRARYQPLTDKQTEAAVKAAATYLDAYVAAKVDDAVKAATARYAEPGPDGKVTVTGEVTVAVTVDTEWGASRLVIVEGTGDDAGITVKMFGTGQGLWDADRGDQVTLTGPVKGTEVYQGVKQTRVTRAKITTHTKTEEE